MKPIFCTVRVMLDNSASEPGPYSHDGKRLAGYYQNFGVRAASQKAAEKIVEEFVADGMIDWPGSSFREFDELDKLIAAQFSPRSENLIWYRSGRIFFPAER